MYKLTIENGNRYKASLYLNKSDKSQICEYLNKGMELLCFQPTRDKPYIDRYDSEVIDFIKGCKEQFAIRTDNFLFSLHDEELYFIFSCPTVAKDYNYINSGLAIFLNVSKIEGHL